MQCETQVDAVEIYGGYQEVELLVGAVVFEEAVEQMLQFVLRRWSVVLLVMNEL